MGKILIVDDETDILEILQDLLEEEGYNVTTFENPNQAIEHLKTNKYDLIISDIKMPGMSGVEFLEVIKNFESKPFSNFVFISGPELIT